MNILSGQKSLEIEIQLDGLSARKKVQQNDQQLAVFRSGESIAGSVHFLLKPGEKRFSHNGIKMEFIGLIEWEHGRDSRTSILSLYQQLANAGDLLPQASYGFCFRNVELRHETYAGKNLRLRYFLRLTVERSWRKDCKQELDIAVHKYDFQMLPQTVSKVRLEVGVPNSFSVELVYNRPNYHLKDVIVGTLRFPLMHLKIKRAEIHILRKQSTLFHEELEKVGHQEILDGSVSTGEVIHFRFFLASMEGATPTMTNVQKLFWVRYYLSLVLIDMDNRKYHKMQEIELWRKEEKPPKTTAEKILSAVAKETMPPDVNEGIKLSAASNDDKPEIPKTTDIEMLTNQVESVHFQKDYATGEVTASVSFKNSQSN